MWKSIESKFPIDRNYEHINIGKVKHKSSTEKPDRLGLNKEVSFREFKKGVPINITDTCVVKRGLLKKTYYYFILSTTGKGEDFMSKANNCDKYDSENAGKR